MAYNEIWGNFLVGLEPIPQVPAVDHIHGARLECDQQGKPHQIQIQYDSGGEPRELRMPFADGMFLLSLLKSIQLDTGTPFPDDPRAPSARRK